MYIFIKNHCEFKIGDKADSLPNLDYLIMLKVVDYYDDLNNGVKELFGKKEDENLLEKIGEISEKKETNEIVENVDPAKNEEDEELLEECEKLLYDADSLLKQIDQSEPLQNKEEEILQAKEEKVVAKKVHKNKKGKNHKNGK
jgi:hypothetical protein